MGKKTPRLHMCAAQRECEHIFYLKRMYAECVRVCVAFDFDDNDDYYDAHQQHHIHKTKSKKAIFYAMCVACIDSKMEYDVCTRKTLLRSELVV